MKIKRLDLLAFAHFSERVLNFDGSNLHIVYGPNEAGKSSSLRALKALLFGVDTRTTDNFVHEHSRLRIGGWLENQAGAELQFIRRKGNKNTLLSLQNDILDEQVLMPFLSGVSREVFESLFGIDHQALQQGGKEILQQKGELGQMLFSAAIGSQALHGVLRLFDEEADGLFRPRGSTQKINQLLKQYKALEKAVKDSSGSANQWDIHQRELDKTALALQSVEAELAELRKEVTRLERIQRSLPGLAQHRELRQQLDSLADVIVLADDFSERSRRAQQHLETAQLALEKAESRLQRLVEQQNALGFSSALIEQAERVTALYSQLEQYRQGIRDLPGLDAERRQRQADAEARLRNIRPDLELGEAESLRQIIVHQQAIADMVKERLALDSRATELLRMQRSIEIKLKTAVDERKSLPALDEGEALRLAVAEARKVGDIDQLIRKTEAAVTLMQRRCQDALVRLKPGRGVLDDLPRLALPDRERVQAFEQRFGAQEQDQLRLEEERRRVKKLLREVTFRIDEIQRTGAVPTENELRLAREERNRLWQMLRRQWVEQEDISQTPEILALPEPLPDWFEQRMQVADDISDRLRREAKQVHELIDCQLRRDDAEAQLCTLQVRLEALDRERATDEKRWLALWDQIRAEPGRPAEMRNWLEEVNRLQEQTGQLQQQQSHLDELIRLRDQHKALLMQSWSGATPLPESGLLAPLLQLGEARLEKIEQLRQQHVALEKKCVDLKVERDEVSQERQAVSHEVEVWERCWLTLLEKLGLSRDTTPSQAGGYVHAAQELFQFRDEAHKLEIRIEAIHTTTRQFQQDAAKLFSLLAPELGELPVDEAAVKLNIRLAEAQKNQAQQQEVRQQIDEVREEIEASRMEKKLAESQLLALRCEANCQTVDALEQRQQQSEQKRQLLNTLGDLEKMLLEYGQGIALDALEKEAKAVDRDSLPGEIVALKSRIETELEPRRTELAETKGREEKALELMDGGNQAADLADQAQSVLAAIRTESEKYIRVRLASRILRDEIERYRQENQGPLVNRANIHFARLTLGSFSGLKADLNDRDEPVLVGVRPGGETVDVTGMSSGTRDQLYLALRLASLEKYMETAEPMPFIVDDILVDFDDQRSQAALEALAELAEKTQVILFTHHASVVEQAQALPTSVNVLELQVNS